MEKAYDPSKYEPQIRKLWEDKQSFALGSNAPNAEAEPFTIIMPPPNANGSLHAGHLMYVVEDIMTRYARMQGRPTLWLPGTDHAGIETQFVYEKELAKSGKTRHDLGQDKFYAEVWDFVEHHKGTMIEQMKAMGFSADWDKLKYTLDDDVVEIVLDTFKHLHEDGLIYRGNRIVNWDPVTQSAYADIELKHVEQEGKLYTLDYGSVQIATVRPETIFGDVAIAVNPNDARYANLIGQTATIPLINRPIPIIADEHVEPDFGTGALKITPGHDKNDYEIGLRHDLPQITVIDFAGNMINVPSEYAGLPVLEARTKIVAALEKAEAIVKTEAYTHSIALQDRSGAQIEPLITEQWFLRVAELNKPVIEAIESEAVQMHPKRFKKIALDWLTNEHDWCISRQIWWGIRIPVYYKTSHDVDKDAYIIAKTESEAIAYYGEGNYRAETDTFDTWFSSGQWPYATLMTSLAAEATRSGLAHEQTWQDFYPTSVMATARDILHKWVTRMIMFSLYKTGSVPFEHVYLWGMVTDEKGQKLSKSKGNYEDPMSITAEYGTDALRLALSIGITPGNDGKLSIEKIKGYRNFCNKLWNVARFALSRLETVEPLELGRAAGVDPEGQAERSDDDSTLSSALDTNMTTSNQSPTVPPTIAENAHLESSSEHQAPTTPLSADRTADNTSSEDISRTFDFSKDQTTPGSLKTNHETTNQGTHIPTKGTSNTAATGAAFDFDKLELLSPADHWIVEKAHIAIQSTTAHLNNYRFSEAGETVYHLLWHEFADCYIEYSKQSLNPQVLAYVLDVILRLAHPFAPFVTEAIWQELPWTDTQLITEHWPNTIIRTDAELSKPFELEIIAILAAKQAESASVQKHKLEKELLEKERSISLITAKLKNADFIKNAPASVIASERARLEVTRHEIDAIQQVIQSI